MVKVQEPLESAINETESIIQACQEKIRQALEADSNKLKEKAEIESRLIIARAKEEAEKTIDQARQDAKAESERIIEAAQEAARQESAKVISETKEKTRRIIINIFEHCTTQSQNELAATVSEARNKTSLLLTQINERIEQIIEETETSIKTELEHLTNLMDEIETKLQSPPETPEKEPEAHSKNAIKESIAPAPPVSKKIEPVIPSTGSKRGTHVRENDDARLFSGSLKLEIIPPYNQEQTKGVPETLARLTDSKVVSTGGYISGNKRISTYTIDLDQPAPLLKILKNLSDVKDVSEQKGDLIITL